ncbi:MAG: tetratricopeptide repeat protein [Deltaproteobacteria bacterium]|nr:tetratricopeptide repeat protein [Deltaproteobacteria bacterium]
MGDLLSTTSIGPRRGLLRARTAHDWYERGLALEDTAPDQAIAAYRRALLGRADLADAHNNLGRLLHDKGELKLAESHYRLALTCDREVALYWFNLGVVVEDRGRIDDAIESYQQALALDPALVDAHFNVARLYEQLGRSSHDELMLRRAIRHLADYRRLAASSASAR